MLAEVTQIVIYIQTNTEIFSTQVLPLFTPKYILSLTFDLAYTINMFQKCVMPMVFVDFDYISNTHYVAVLLVTR